MLSIILPYWNRQSAANEAFKSLEKYADLDMEVIVVDDGNVIPFVVPDTKLDVRVIRLPLKNEPKSPVTCWNEGVKAASGKIIILSCIEVLHETHIISDLIDGLEENEYRLAAAWCPEENKWHTHSTVEVPDCPKGTGLGFCGAMYKTLYEKAGGWDEDYREGAGYEDRDFIHRMLRAGAGFNIRDDLVVIHPKSGASINWGADKFIRNQALFKSKWLKPVTFVCLKAGTEYTSEYVNILYDMVSRNLSLGYPGKFVCITDDHEGLNEGIEVLPLPEDLEKWWGKLYMFKKGLFEGKVIYLDLDTVILGKLDDLVAYQGQFATLRDFYQPQRLGPAIIIWQTGELSESIWNEWVSQSKPRSPMGDLWWLNNLDQGNFAKRIDKLQDIFPEMFASFKADCKPYPPKGAKIVCFHGQPRPHNACVDWVEQVWKIGGGVSAELEIVSNTHRQKIQSNVLSAVQRNLPVLKSEEDRNEICCIVAGGPSTKEKLEEIRWRYEQGSFIIAVNGSARFLQRNGINPHAHVMIDSREENIDFVNPPLAKQFYIASNCDPSIFEKLKDEKVTLFHMNNIEVAEILPNGTELLSTGSTVGLAAMGIAYIKGFKVLHLFGMDSSYTDARHSYSQPQNDGDSIIEASVGGRVFKCAPWMVAQVNEFQTLANQLADAGLTIIVSGDGLLPYVAKQMEAA